MKRPTRLRLILLQIAAMLPAATARATDALITQAAATAPHSQWDIVQMVQNVVILMLAIYTFTSNRHQATQNRVDSLEQRVAEKQDTLSERVSALEGITKNMPTQRDLNDINASIAGLGGQVGSILDAQKVMRDNLQDSLRPLANMQSMLTQHQFDQALDHGKPASRTSRRTSK